jgi:hypothetical protein
MGLETGDYVNDFVITNPTASDPVSQGDNQIRLVKKLVKQSLPSVDAPVNAIHTGTSAPSVSPSEGLVWIDTSAGAGNHVIKVYDGAVFLTLPFSVEVAKTVDVDGGVIDGAVIGGTTPAAITGTTLTGNTSLALATGATVTGIDDGTVGTGSATLIATQNAVKAYVDAQVTAQDLDLISDSGTIDIDLDSDSLTVAGGTGLATAATGTTLTINGEDATTSAKGIASFDSDHFSVTAGAVSIATDAIDDTLIDFGTGASQVSTADVPEQTNLYYTNTRADDRIAAADIDVLNNVVITSIADDEILRYDAVSSTWKNELSVTPDQLSVKGDLLAYNGSAGETRYPMPGSPVSDSNGMVLTADSTATNGFEWQDLVDNSAAMALALGG